MCDYEAIRLKNLEDNRRVLASFKLLDPFKSVPKVIKKEKKFVYKPPESKQKSQHSITENHFVGRSVYGTRHQTAQFYKSVGSEVSYEELDLDIDNKPELKVTNYRPPHIYGEIAGVDVGTVWSTRWECCKDGIHRATVAGIHGGENGAYSIALSGGYEDDVDLGDCFTYTGEGGRNLTGTQSNRKNLRTAPQSKDQTLTRGNLALSKNVETRNPVRVIRGYKLASPFAPEEGYRYDGLYTVEKCWFTTGVSGFGVWRFALKRCQNQAPSPWQFATDPNISAKPLSCTVSDNHQITFDSPNHQHVDAASNNLSNCDYVTENHVRVKSIEDKTIGNLGDDSKEGLQEIVADSFIAPARKRTRKNN